jgi:serine/threonine protein kinase
MIKHYRIIDMLGRGGMGVVYKALDTKLDREVALKMMDFRLTQDEVFLKRFNLEAKALAKLRHQHIVTIFTLEDTEMGLLMVMEFVEGVTLAELLKRQNAPLPYKKALPILKQILEAVGYAHQNNIIHRDIKPSNVMITQQGEVKVTDFGLVKFQHGPETTMTLYPIGTLLYMPPEQVKNSAKVDRRSDIYSVGMTLYEMLAGRTPIATDLAQVDIFNAILAGQFPAPTQFNPAIPPALSKIVMTAIATDPAQRFQSTAEMSEALAKFEAAREPSPPPQRKKRWSRRFTLIASSLFIAPLVVGIVLTIASLFLEYRSPWFNKKNPGENVGAPKDSSKLTPDSAQKQTPPISPSLTHSALIKELSGITATTVLQQKLAEYRRAMQIAVGKEGDFESLEGCYVFVCDEQNVLGVFQFKGNVYYAVNSTEIYSRLSEKFPGKTKIWVRDYSVP